MWLILRGHPRTMQGRTSRADGCQSLTQRADSNLGPVEPVRSVPSGSAPEQEPGVPLLPAPAPCRGGDEGLHLVPLQPALVREQEPMHIMSLQDA